MIDYKEIPFKGDGWELFARDFLQERGFFIESPPDRGADAGKDMLAIDELKGNLNKYRFRWLVSCKHLATSGASVSEEHEKNHLERVKAFNADGFLGFYSTLASAGLNNRLRMLRQNGEIKDYYIYDHKSIENLLVTAGYSHLMLRYFPESYKQIKPIHFVTSMYEPLECDKCGRDLLLNMIEGKHSAVIAYVSKFDKNSGKTLVEDIYCACKGECDRILERQAFRAGFLTSWIDLQDVVIPPEFLRIILATMNNVRSGEYVYSDTAFEKEKEVFIKIAQKVFRFTTERERQRFNLLFSLPRF
jgi:hypothetical protein